MDQSFRLPLIQSLEPRDNTLEKDELSSNIMYDKSNKEHTYAVKRPGLSTLIGALGRPAGYYDFQGSPDYYVPWEGTFGAFVYGDIFFGLGPPPPYSWVGKWLNGRFVGVGFSGVIGFEEYIVAESLDGKTWEYKASIAAYDEGAYNYVDDIIYNGSHYVLYIHDYESGLGNSKIWSSPDLETWTYEGEQSWGFVRLGRPITISQQVNGDYYCIPGLPFKSADGITWTTLLPEATFYFVGYTATEIRLFRGEIGTPGTVHYLTTSDGVVYTTVSAPGTFPLAYPGDNPEPARLVNGIWFYPIENVLYSSTDFLQWTPTTLNGIGNYSPVIWDGTQYIILGGKSGLVDPANYYYSSTDGINWELGYFPGPLGSSAAVVFTTNGIPVPNEEGVTVVFPRNNTLDAPLERGQGFYTLEDTLNWEDNKLTTYFNPIPSQETL